MGVTGPAGIQAGLATVFQGADLRLLLATVLVVALLQVITYRSPVLWVIHLVVVAVADRWSPFSRPTRWPRPDSPGTNPPSASSRCWCLGAGRTSLLLISLLR